MPDFTVIDGGGDTKRQHRENAQRYFQAFIIAMLRDLTSARRSSDSIGPFFTFINYAVDNNVFGELDVLENAIRELSSRAFDVPDPDDIEEQAITEAALRVVVERLASDKFAGGRLSQQRERFERVMKICIRSREQRARDNGRSYIADLTKGLGRWPRNKGGSKPKDEPDWHL
jgi:hypothetical protein